MTTTPVHRTRLLSIAFALPTCDEEVVLVRSPAASAGREIGICPEAKPADPVMQYKLPVTLKAKGHKVVDQIFIRSFLAGTWVLMGLGLAAVVGAARCKVAA